MRGGRGEGRRASTSLRESSFFVACYLPCDSEVGETGFGVVVYTIVGRTGVTYWLLQLSPVQHSILQSSKVQFSGWALKAAANAAQAAALSINKSNAKQHLSIEFVETNLILYTWVVYQVYLDSKYVPCHHHHHHHISIVFPLPTRLPPHF